MAETKQYDDEVPAECQRSRMCFALPEAALKHEERAPAGRGTEDDSLIVVKGTFLHEVSVRPSARKSKTDSILEDQEDLEEYTPLTEGRLVDDVARRQSRARTACFTIEQATVEDELSRRQGRARTACLPTSAPAEPSLGKSQRSSIEKVPVDQCCQQSGTTPRESLPSSAVQSLSVSQQSGTTQESLPSSGVRSPKVSALEPASEHSVVLPRRHVGFVLPEAEQEKKEHVESTEHEGTEAEGLIVVKGTFLDVVMPRPCLRRAKSDSVAEVQDHMEEYIPETGGHLADEVTRLQAAAKTACLPPAQVTAENEFSTRQRGARTECSSSTVNAETRTEPCWIYSDLDTGVALSIEKLAAKQETASSSSHQEMSSMTTTPALSEGHLQQPSMSVGSAQHFAGKCRPCAWIWKPAGCENGSSCLHCHLCPENALKENKKKHRALAKLVKTSMAEQKHQYRSSQAQSHAAAVASEEVPMLPMLLGNWSMHHAFA